MNCKYQFYQGYYKEFDPRAFEQDDLNEKIADNNKEAFINANDVLIKFKPSQDLLDKLAFKKDLFGEPLRQFKLITAYPGLVTGTGYTHETGNVGEFKIGFYFDHTTGLPYLPGHSIKGALRHAFPRHNQPRTTEHPTIKQAKARYIVSLLPEGMAIPSDSQYEWVKQLEEHIFEGKRPLDAEGKPIGKADAFLDARISKAEKGRIMGRDSITPHGDKKWKNPTPLPFLKVLPAVEWEFSFLLYDSTVDGIPIKASEKKALFEKILLDLGVGAKTNVGYGQFKPLSPPPPATTATTATTLRQENPAGVSNNSKQTHATFDPAQNSIDQSKLKKGKEVYAQIVAVTANEVQVKLLIDGWDNVETVAYHRVDKPQTGDWCKVKIKDISGKAPKIKKILLETNFITPVNKG